MVPVRQTLETIARITLLALVVLVVLYGIANARPDSRTLTCEQAKKLVKDRGTVVLQYSDRQYEKVVASTSRCDRDERSQLYYVPTRDEKSCAVGYYCYPFSLQNQ